MEGTRLAMEGGKLREGQNWIGGSSYNPCNAAFIPPPPEHLEALLTDLCDFCSTDSLPTAVQAAIAHAQFETIHPFADGNGRTGRALIQVILRRRGLAPRVLPPISLVLATWSNDYIAGLTATRYLRDASSIEALDGLNRWIGLFSAAVKRAVDDARMLGRELSACGGRTATIGFLPIRLVIRRKWGDYRPYAALGVWVPVKSAQPRS